MPILKQTITIPDGGRLEITATYNEPNHPHFSITAGIYGWDRPDNPYASGCLHDEIRRYAPHLAKYVKWHLCDDKGPMRYLADTLYLAGDRDHNGKAKGEATRFEYGVQFDKVPITFMFKSKEFYEFAVGVANSEPQDPGAVLKVVEVPAPFKGGTPNFTLEGYPTSWALAPFSTYLGAAEFALAIATCTTNFMRHPVAWSDGKPRDLNGARNTAVWPEATDEQLSLPRNELKKLLEDRLPGLIREFHTDMEELFSLPSYEVSDDDLKAAADFYDELVKEAV